MILVERVSDKAQEWADEDGTSSHRVVYGGTGMTRLGHPRPQELKCFTRAESRVKDPTVCSPRSVAAPAPPEVARAQGVRRYPRRVGDPGHGGSRNSPRRPEGRTKQNVLVGNGAARPTRD